MRLPLLPHWIRLLIVIAVSSVILYFSVIKPPATPGGAGPFWDKQLHFLAYGGLSLVYAYATVQYQQSPVTRSIGVILAVILFGVLVELLQSVVPTRSFSGLDILANMVGVVLASVWFALESRISYRHVDIESITTR